MKALVVLLALAALACGLCASASADEVFFTDFDSGVPSEITGAGSIWSAEGFGGLGDVSGNVLRNFERGNPAGGTFLNLSSIGAHSGLIIELDLLAYDSWDGDTPIGGTVPPDFFNVQVDGTTVFSETIDLRVIEDGSIFSSTDATLVSSVTPINLGGSFYEDSLYHLTLSLSHSSSTASVSFFASGSGWQGGGDENWGMDNLSVSTTVDPVPEPSTLALVVAALVALVAWRRVR